MLRVALLLAGVSALTACGPRGDLTHALADVGEVNLDVDFADRIHVVGDSDVTEGTLVATFASDDGVDPAGLNDISIDVAAAGATYNILSRMPEDKEGLHLELTLTLPAGTDVVITDPEVDRVVLEGELGTLTLSGQKGNVEFVDVATGGDFDVGLFPGSASGSVEVAAGSYFGLSTANGRIDLALDVKDGAEASMRASLGDIALDVSLGEDTDLNARTRGGALSLALPPSTGAEITATGSAVTISGHTFEGTDFTDLKIGALDGGGSREITLTATSTVDIR